MLEGVFERLPEEIQRIVQSIYDRCAYEHVQIQNRKGNWNSGEVSEEEFLHVYACGVLGVTPERWKALSRRLELSRDPDYKLFLELKEKFKDM
jgi:hypothetical protein